MSATRLSHKLKRLFGGTREAPAKDDPNRYEGDGMILKARNLSWMRSPEFQRAYQRGINSGHQWSNNPKHPLKLEWRVKIALWAAHQATQVPGDFVECGVNTGILSLAICEDLAFHQLGRRMFLFDTYAGIPEHQMTEKERPVRVAENAAAYPDCYERVKQNFAAYPNVQLVRGIVPESLGTVQIDRVAYLSLDMNIALPERAAIEFFWDKISPGGVVLLDDYGWKGFEEQMTGMDAFAAGKGLRVACLPTGQGLLIKPPAANHRPA